MRGSAATPEKTAPFWQASVGKALPDYQDAFLTRVADRGTTVAAETMSTSTADSVTARIASRGDAMVFLHEQSSVHGALEEMVRRGASFLFVVGDPIQARLRQHVASVSARAGSGSGDSGAALYNRETEAAEDAAQQHILRVSATETAADDDSQAVIGLFTERDFIRCVARAVGYPFLSETKVHEHMLALHRCRLRDMMTPMHPQFGTLKVASNTVQDAVRHMIDRDVQTVPVIREEAEEEDYTIPPTRLKEAAAGGSQLRAEDISNEPLLAIPPSAFRGVVTARDLARFFSAQSNETQDAVCTVQEADVDAETRPAVIADMLETRMRQANENVQQPSRTRHALETRLFDGEHHRVVSVPRNLSVREAIVCMARHNVGTLLVTPTARAQSGRDRTDAGEDAGGPYPSIEGTLTARDLIRHVFAKDLDATHTRVDRVLRAVEESKGGARVMQERMLSVTPEDEVSYVLHLLGHLDERHMPIYVYDDDDQTSNCVAMVSIKECMQGLYEAEQARTRRSY